MTIESILIGTGVKNAHTTDETITLSSLVNLANILINFCARQQTNTDIKALFEELRAVLEQTLN